MSVLDARITESKVRKSKLVRPPTKVCPICKTKKELDQFYSNANWAEESGKDKWCKACVASCTSKYKMQEYFWENRREWNESLWSSVLRKAEQMLSEKAIYQKATDEKRKELLEKTAAKLAPPLFASSTKFANRTEKTKNLTFQQAIEKGIVRATDDDPNEKRYDEFFNGYFTAQDIEYLQTYYNKLEEDFSFDNENLRDYAKKCARASLQADKAQDNYAAGRCSFADVKDALMQFDMLSKSANFAACKRKVGEVSGLTSWAETTMYLETHGYCKETKVKWPEDDVDRVITALTHTVRSLGLDSM